MQAHQKAEKTFQPFSYGYINDYVEQYKKNSAWNKTQLTSIVETLVNFIDCYTELFMKVGSPGNPVWMFEQLLTIEIPLPAVSLGFYERTDRNRDFSCIPYC